MTISYSNRPAPFPAVLGIGTRDILIFALGQSNEQSATTSGQPINAGLDQDASGRIIEYRTNATSGIAAVQPMTWPLNNVNLGPARSFAMAQRLLPRVAPDKKIVIIPAAVGGTGLYNDTWAAPSGALYLAARTALINALADYPGALVILSWTGGENDSNANVSAANHTTAFNGMVAGFRAVSGAEDMLVCIHQLVPERFIPTPVELPGRAVIDAAQKALPLTLPRSIFFGAELGYQIVGDPSHYTAPGQRLAGQHMADLYDLARLFSTYAPPVPAPPVAASGSTITVTVTNPPAPAYVVETRPGGSSGAWTERVVYPPLWALAGATFTANVFGDGGTEIRLRTRSYAGTSAPSSSITAGVDWWYPGSFIHLDGANSRWRVNGVTFASKAAMVTAGVLTQTGGIDRYPVSPGGSWTLAARGVTAATTVTTPRYLAALDDGSDGAPVDNMVYLAQVDDLGTPKIQQAIFVDGVSPATFVSSAGGGNSAPVRMAIRQTSATGAGSSILGAVAGTATLTAYPTLTQLVVGNRDDGTRPWLGTVGQIVLVKSAVLDVDLAKMLA